jgi:hypothetical protein
MSASLAAEAPVRRRGGMAEFCGLTDRQLASGKPPEPPVSQSQFEGWTNATLDDVMRERLNANRESQNLRVLRKDGEPDTYRLT